MNMIGMKQVLLGWEEMTLTEDCLARVHGLGISSDKIVESIKLGEAF
jgi:hypothetical protein